MVAPYPMIDPRRAKKLVAELERLAAVFVPGLRGITTENSPGRAIVEIAGRLAGQVTQRLDKIPRRDAIAFFDTLDVPQEAPRSARAPLIFTLSDKRDKPVHAPARIQVAASPPDGEEVIFETISALNLTPARLDYLAAVDTKKDHIEEPPPQFYRLAPAEPQTNYQVVTLANAGSDTLQISPAVGLEQEDVIGIDNQVYRIKETKDGLVTLVEQDRLEQTVDANTPVLKVTRFNAFQLRNLQRHLFYVGHAELLNLEQPSTIRLGISPPAAASRLVNLGLTIEIYGTKQGEEQPRWHQFEEENIAARAGEILLIKDWQGSVDEFEIHQQKSRWLKIELERAIKAAQPTNTRIARFALGVESGRGAAQTESSDSHWCFTGDQKPDEKEETELCMPCDVGDPEGSQTIKQAFHNASPLPLTTRFSPFGAEPLRFDTFALAAPEALSKKGAKVALAINLVDATPAVLEMALSSSPPTGVEFSTVSASPKHAYAIGVNGRLQVLEFPETETPEGGILDRWQELSHPDKLPEDNAGSNDIKTLRLDSSLSPQAVQIILSREIFDLVVVGDQGGRLWATNVSEKSGGAGGFTRSDWKNIPLSPIPDDAKIADLVLLPVPPNNKSASPNFSFAVTAAFLFAVTGSGFYSLNISSTGQPLSEWQKCHEDSLKGNSNPTFSSEENPGVRPRLVPILSSAWPSPPNAFPLGLVLLDADGVLWHGCWNWDFPVCTVKWNLLTTVDSELASHEVRPVAAKLADGPVVLLAATKDNSELEKLADHSFALFAATKDTKELFGLIVENGSPRSVCPSTPFEVQSGTELLCDPSFLGFNAVTQPIVLAFGQTSMALWLGDEFECAPYPEARSPSGKPSGIFVPLPNSELPPAVFINGRRETLYWTVPIHLDQDAKEATLGIDNWAAEFFPRTEQNPELSWEYFNGDGWRRLDEGFNDTTNHLAESGRICFCVPDDIAPTEISGQEDFWIRARLVGGDYGRAKYVVTTEDTNNPKITTQSVTVDTSDLRAPEILAIEACFKMTGTVAPQLVLTENNRAVLDQTQASSTASAQFELFEGVAAIDAKLESAEQGRALYLGLTKPYNVNPLTLFIDADEPDDHGDQLETFELLFEVLELEQRWRKVAADDQTGGFQRRGLVKLFIGSIPQRARLFGRDLFWLRVRPGGKGDRWKPLLNGLYLNAGEAVQARSVKQEILGSSTGEPNQRFFLSKIPVISNSLELRVRETLSEDERLELEQAAKDRRDSRQPESDRAAKPVITTYPDIPGRWILWQQVDSFVEQDGDARVYQLDPATGEVRFGDDQQGKIPPAGQDALRAIEYQNGGGEQGNVAAFTIEGLKSSVESVDSVTNPIPAAGGVDALDVDTLISTAPDRLRHRQQALTTVDIEALAVAWSSEIVRARCMTPDEPTDPIKVFIARRTGERCPKASLAERDALARYLREQGWGALGERSIRVFNPDYVHLSVIVEILAESSETVAAVEKASRERLLKLLHPIDGGLEGSGWPFGRGIWKSDLFRALADVPGLDRVDNIELEPKSLDNLPPSALICADEAKVEVLVEFESGESPS